MENLSIRPKEMRSDCLHENFGTNCTCKSYSADENTVLQEDVDLNRDFITAQIGRKSEINKWATQQKAQGKSFA